MSVKALAEYTTYSRYAKYLPEKKRRETWKESCDRMFDDMHFIKFKDLMDSNPEFKSLVLEAKKALIEKKILGSQRALQFGGDPILKHNFKLFNCAFGHLCRPEAFYETMFLLLCGCGVGFSVQKHHIKMLPPITHINKEDTAIFKPEDSIEGWSDCIGVMIGSYMHVDKFEEYYGKNVTFDLSDIRPEGSLIAGQFKAPGPNGLQSSLKKIRHVIDDRLGSDDFNVGEFAGKLRPIDVYDIIMHESDAVLSGGVRRSATICLFSIDDGEMMGAKTGNWFIENPQRGRSNNSVALIRNEVLEEQFLEIKSKVMEFGEPGFLFVDDEECGANPCVEIGFRPVTEDGRHGYQLCNLSEINGKYTDTEEKFYECCRASAIIGSLQAAYTDFTYLSDATKELSDKEALLGVSITGTMDNPQICLDPEIQRKGAEVVKEVNAIISEMLGINKAARTTCIKPSGSASCVLGTSSGIHPHHAHRYFRRVQANKMEFPVKFFEMFNPTAIEESVWSSNNTDVVITFLCKAPKGSIVKNQLGAVDLLRNVRKTQENWVEYGTREELSNAPYLRHNVSNTISVKPDEWDDTFDYIWKYRYSFSGVSLLPISGDKDYPQAPFCKVYTNAEIVKQYGDAAMFASGLITAALEAFNNNLWEACDYTLGVRGFEELETKLDSVINEFSREIAILDNYEKNTSPVDMNYELLFDLRMRVSELDDERDDLEEDLFLKKDWVRRACQFAHRYTDDDIKLTTYCLKDVHNLKTWRDLQRKYIDVDWSSAFEENQAFVSADTLGAASCSGGNCEIT